MPSPESGSQTTDTDNGQGPEVPPYESSPFTDWRDQLRDRVKEIRARKLADKRRSSEPFNERLERQAEEAREEKLRAARTRAAEANTEAHDDDSAEAPAPTVPAIDETEDPADVQAAALEALEALKAESASRMPETDATEAAAREPVPAEAADVPEPVRAEAADVPEPAPPEATEAREPAPTEAADATDSDGPPGWDWFDDVEEPSEAPAAVEGVEVAAPEDVLEEADEVSGLENAESDSEQEVDRGAPPRDEVPEFAAYDVSDDDVVGEMPLAPVTDPTEERSEAPSPGRGAARARLAPDLSSIPEELRDAKIPAWAIPRRPSEAIDETLVDDEGAVDDGASDSAHTAAEGGRDLDELTREALDAVDRSAAASDVDKTPVEEEAVVQEIDTAPEDEPLAVEPASPPRPAGARPARLPWEEEPAAENPMIPEAPPLEPGSDPLWRALDAARPIDEEMGDGDESVDEDSPVSGKTVDDDVYLVGEFATRKPGEDSPRRAPFQEEEEELDPLEALRKAIGRKSKPATTPAPAAPVQQAPAAWPQPTEAPNDPDGPRRAIPNLYDSEDDPDVEQTPSPFADLEEMSPATEGAALAEAAWDDLTAEVDDEQSQPADQIDPSAPVSDRIYSSLADGLVVATLGLLLGLAGAAAAGTTVPLLVRSAPVPFAIAWLLFAFTYGVFFVGTCGQTLGKMVMRVRVIGARRFEVGYATAVRRALWYTAATLPAGLGLLPALRDPEHRALHDRLSGTRVVKA